MTPEQKFWNLIKDHIPGHVQRIESVVGVGVPDVNYSYEGRETWIELKANIGLNFATTGDKLELLDHIHKWKIRLSQFMWHYARYKSGGRVLICTRDNDNVILLECVGNIRYLVLCSLPKPWNWDVLESHLKGWRSL